MVEKGFVVQEIYLPVSVVTLSFPSIFIMKMLNKLKTMNTIVRIFTIFLLVLALLFFK